MAHTRVRARKHTYNTHVCEYCLSPVMLIVRVPASTCMCIFQMPLNAGLFFNKNINLAIHSPRFCVTPLTKRGKAAIVTYPRHIITSPFFLTQLLFDIILQLLILFCTCLCRCMITWFCGFFHFVLI